MSRDPEILNLTAQVRDVVTQAYVLSLKLKDTLGVLYSFEPRFTQLAVERRQTPTVMRETEERRHG